MTKSSGASSEPEAGAPVPIALVGATASGKTAVGIHLAEALDTEIIGCDSRQVYRRLDIGSAKPTPAERRRVRHHLVDVADPAERYSAARYRDDVLALLPAFAARARVPLFVGGTGLYLRAALEGLCPAPPALPGLRRWIAALGATLPGGLHPLLACVDAAAAARIHPNDRFRLNRSLEVFYLSGETLTEHQQRHRDGRMPVAVRVFGLDVPGAEIRRRINERLDEMLAAGFLEEARNLLADGIDPALPAFRAVGYPELIAHLRGETTLDTALEAVRRATWQYARRQLTWFRGLRHVSWIPASAGTSAADLAGVILRQLRDGGEAP
ncbi:MAG: tRNA (adenosine(37)-N6)-dimethylallyltransferase MiaA [Candidatus Methylomirabilia bacterium]